MGSIPSENEREKAAEDLDLIVVRDYPVVKDNKLIQNVTRRKYEFYAFLGVGSNSKSK